MDIIDYIEDLKWRMLENFNIDNKCSRCDMCIEERVSYEYDEYDSHCLNGKDIYDIEYCFTPLLYSKLKAKFVKQKMLDAEQEAIAKSYADMAEWFAKQEKKDSSNADMV